MSEHIGLTAQCLCRQHTFRATIPKSSLPFKASCCHCKSCRHLTGALYSAGANWPGPVEAIQKSTLQLYNFSPRIVQRFCGTCFSLMFYEKHAEADGPVTEFGVYIGTLEATAHSDLVSIRQHVHVADTIDGGASMWLRQPNLSGPLARRWTAGAEASTEIPIDWPPLASLPAAGAKSSPSSISIQCHCRGVDLVLRRPIAAFAGQAKEQLPWYIDPSTHKYLAGFDACNSCRLASGVPLFNWSFVPLAHIDFAASGIFHAGDKFPRTTAELKASVSAKQTGSGSRFGDLTFYASSEGVQRYFCRRCSACVFYACDDRQDMVDLAIGLLDSPDGARAEGTLSWALGGNIGWRNDASGTWRESLIRAVEAEAEAWRIARRYPKDWRRVDREKAQQKAS